MIDRGRALVRAPEVPLVVVATLVGLVVAVRSRGAMLDDVGITARYAQRIGDGLGWTYNDGDRTNGASAPLYTMMLAAAHKLGLDILTAARAICVVSIGLSAGLIAHIATRVAGRLAGAIGALFLITWPFFNRIGTAGMESALSGLLGLAVIAALLHRREVAAGVLLGLALLTKLDAGLLAVAVAAAVVVVERRPPWRIAAVSGAILAPWLLFSWIYFGHPLPNSFTQKASGEVTHAAFDFDRTWIIDNLWHSDAMILVAIGLASLALVPWLRQKARPGAAMAVVAAVAWPLAHGLAYSLIDLGDAYIWYMVVLSPPITLAAGIALGRLVHLGGAPRVLGVVMALVLAGQAIGLVGPPSGTPIGRTAQAVKSGRVPDTYDGLEFIRQAAGRRLGELAEPGDVVLTCYGWIAFFAPQTTIHESCPLNTRINPGEPDWAVDVTYPGTHQTPSAPNWVLEDSIYSDVGEGARVDIYRVEPVGIFGF